MKAHEGKNDFDLSNIDAEGFNRLSAEWIQRKIDIEDELNNLDKSLKEGKITSREHKDLGKEVLEESKQFQHASFYSQALLNAAKNGDEKIIGKLIGFKADLNVKDERGNTPLKLAAEAGQVDTVELLLNNGADPNIQSNKGNTALHAAAVVIDEETAKKITDMLLAKKANPTIKNKDGETSANAAASVGHQSLAKFLLEKIRAFFSGNKADNKGKKDASVPLKWQLNKENPAKQGKRPGVTQYKQDQEGAVELPQGRAGLKNPGNSGNS